MPVKPLTLGTLMTAAVLSAWSPCGTFAQVEAPEPLAQRQAAFFETRIRPILVEHCHDCHSGDEPESQLDLSTRSGMLRGGQLGSALVPGDAKASLLISAVNHDEFIKMPPKQKLVTRQVLDLTRWVEMGAPWPGAAASTFVGSAKEEALPRFTNLQRGFWAFQPVRDPPLPRVQDTTWPTSAIDSFVLARLEAAGMRPAPAAEKRMLIRRVTYDLTGLPPTVRETEAFLRDNAHDAYPKLVDRLLASPRYGERWGRHWLDVVRYADSNGLDENLAYANAFRYRDYVIAAFNKDKPYDRFLQEQIAGDLLATSEGESDLAESSFERFVATGFLAIGPKMLAEDDPVKMQMDIIDEQLNTLGQAFLGLTLGSRCHDHKFDPILADDYYALAGIFKSTKTMENHNVVAVWYQRPLLTEEESAVIARQGQRIQRLKRRLTELQEKQSPPSEDRGAAAASDASACGAETHLPDSLKAELDALAEEIESLEQARPTPPLAMGVTEGEPQDLAIHLRGSPITLGRSVPRRTLAILDRVPQPPIDGPQSGRRQLAAWMSEPENPLTGRVMVNRIWHWHFGRGFVATVDNFGRLGERPTHPALLDWLVSRFVHNGWSMKRIQRMILLSSTYQMSSRYDAAAAGADPENSLLWRRSRRRLTAEEVRDSILVTGGGLDLKMGGSLLKVKDRDYVTVSNSRLTDEYENRRRSVYLPIIRSSVYDVFQTLDFPDPAVLNGRRQTTTVAPQALLMLNAEFVMEAATEVAEGLLQAATAERHRIDLAWQSILGRQANDTEQRMAAEFLQQARKLSDEPGSECEDFAWRSLCRMLYASNEFIFVE